jgi:hypothetical protein
MGIQIIPQQGSLSSRIGRGFAQGISNQLPKELERYRLSSGLKKFSQNAQNLNPMQQLAEVSSIYGVTPQMIQSFSELAKQQSQANALNQGIGRQNEQQQFPTRSRQEMSPGVNGEGSKSITTTEPIQETIENYIPRTYEQNIDRAEQLYNSNKALYKNDPNNAIQAAIQEDQSNQNRNVAQQNKRKTQQDVQERVQNELRTQSQNAGVKIPDNVYSDIEDRALEAVNSGRMTELEAGKKYKKELDAISRDYQSVKDLGTWKLISKSASANKDAMESLRKKFEQRDDLENFADTLVAENNLSPSKAYYKAYPVSKNKELNNEISKLKDINPKIIDERTKMPTALTDEERVLDTLTASRKIAPKMGRESSPLAIAEELKAKGYDPNVWLNYVDKNRKKLNLTERQARQLDKPRNFISTLDDIWLFSFSGLDKLVEQ